LQKVKVFEEDVLDWEVVGVECDDKDGAVVSLGGGGGCEGLGTRDGAGSVKSVATKLLRVAPRKEEREHELGLGVEVRVRAAKATESEELGKGNAALGRLGMAGGEEEVGVRVCRFIVNGSSNRR
jgi:hypothetical protein